MLYSRKLKDSDIMTYIIAEIENNMFDNEKELIVKLTKRIRNMKDDNCFVVRSITIIKGDI